MEDGKLVIDVYFKPVRSAFMQHDTTYIDVEKATNEHEDMGSLIREVYSRYKGRVNDETTRTCIMNDITFLMEQNPQLLKGFKSQSCKDSTHKSISDNRSEFEKEIAERILG